MSKARQSPAVRASYRKISRTHKEKNIRPPIHAFAGSMATRQLRRMGISRRRNPELWAAYRDIFLKQLQEKEKHSV